MVSERLFETQQVEGKGINSLWYYRDVEDVRTIFMGLIPVYHYERQDRLTEKYALVCLANDGYARQADLARAFGYGIASLRRWQRGYTRHGISGLGRKLRCSPRLKVDGAMDRAIRALVRRGQSNLQIAQALGVAESTIRRSRQRLGLPRVAPASTEPLPLPGPSGADQPTCESGMDLVETPAAAQETNEITPVSESAPAHQEARQEAAPTLPASLDSDPLNRQMDRALACIGALDDAAPLFAPGQQVPGAGVLLAVPLIQDSGVLGVFADVVRTLAPAFYGLRTVVMTLLFMALLRIKRPERLRTLRPVDLGRVLGLDRALEVKTLRRKLERMGRGHKGLQVMRELARRRLRSRNRIGFFYVDGHVREYHGTAKLGKGYVTRRRLAAPASTDTWVNDADGSPVFVVTSQLNSALTKMLEPIVDELQQVLGTKRRFTVIFDRGGWSPALFARLIARGVDVMTYRKGKSTPIPQELFRTVTARIDNRKVSYQLHDTTVRLAVYGHDQRELRLRQVTRLRSDTGSQTQVLTNREDLRPEHVLYRMFNRWRQENYFKYMRQEYALDALLEYGAEPVDSSLDRPNPLRLAVDKDLRKAQAELRELERAYGQAAARNPESARPSMRGFKIAHGRIGKAIRCLHERILTLKNKRDALPKRVPATGMERLPSSVRLITDAIKMTAYQVESQLVDMVWDHYPRAAMEGHSLIVAALTSAADIHVEHDVLRVTLAAQSSPHRTRAIASLCEQLTARCATFPGTRLRINYAVAET
jgi:transposase